MSHICMGYVSHSDQSFTRMNESWHAHALSLLMSSSLIFDESLISVLQCVAVCCNVWQCVAVYGSVVQCAAVCCSVLQCVAVCCSVLQCVAVCCSVLQCVAVCCSEPRLTIHIYQ